MSLDSILTILENRGWHAYLTDGYESPGEIIARGPAALLDAGGKYVVLPATSNPYDSEAVRLAMVRLTEMHMAPPVIRYHGKMVDFGYFSVSDSGIVVRNGTEVPIPGHEAYSALETIADIRRA